jgi:hypothetical protein
MKQLDDVIDLAPFAVPVGFILLLIFGSHASADARMEVVGSIIGAALTIFGAFWVFRLQIQTTEERHQKTLRDLISDLRKGGESMVQNAAEGAAVATADTVLAYEAARAVSAQLRANSATMARVAQKIEMDPVQRQLLRLINSQNPVQIDVQARGEEVVALADKLAEILKGHV